ncbi:PREDICTED: Krueppel-like factor 17 [Condylura cristata]|uniref:Krueppel-like factor 17 n=1 Tax=Condylura cristata TaxID=143302 RepID=UPI000334592C|nr:PREDICTED: Krueppel-like factor 17 [Condylura cristata]
MWGGGGYISRHVWASQLVWRRRPRPRPLRWKSPPRADLLAPQSDRDTLWFRSYPHSPAPAAPDQAGVCTQLPPSKKRPPTHAVPARFSSLVTGRHPDARTYPDLRCETDIPDAEKSTSVLDMSTSRGDSGVHASWNPDPQDTQPFPQCTELEKMPLVSAEAARLSAGEMGQQFNVPVPEQGVNYGLQGTLAPAQNIYFQGVAPTQPGMIFEGSQTMPSGKTSIPGVAMTYGGNLRMPPHVLPISAPSGSPVMPHIRAPEMPYCGTPIVPTNRDSVTPKMLLTPTMPSAEGQAMHPCLAQMMPPRNPHALGTPPARSSSLLVLESQDSFVSQPTSQSGPSLPEQPIPAAQRAEQNSRAQERAPRRPLVSRPYHCQFENCGKAYTKRSHLVSHQRKHTGQRPYKCSWEGCTWSFFRSDELGRHIRIHTKYRPHRCDQCGRQFMRSDHLRQHQRTHQRMPRSLDPQANTGHTTGL